MTTATPTPDDTSATGLLLDVPLHEVCTRDVTVTVHRLEGRHVAGCGRWRRIQVEVTSSVFGHDEAELFIAREFRETDERDLGAARDDADNWAAVMAEALQLAADHYKKEAGKWGIPPA